MRTKIYLKAGAKLTLQDIGINVEDLDYSQAYLIFRLATETEIEFDANALSYIREKYGDRINEATQGLCNGILNILEHSWYKEFNIKVCKCICKQIEVTMEDSDIADTEDWVPIINAILADKELNNLEKDIKELKDNSILQIQNIKTVEIIMTLLCRLCSEEFKEYIAGTLGETGALVSSLEYVIWQNKSKESNEGNIKSLNSF